MTTDEMKAMNERYNQGRKILQDIELVKTTIKNIENHELRFVAIGDGYSDLLGKQVYVDLLHELDYYAKEYLEQRLKDLQAKFEEL